MSFDYNTCLTTSKVALRGLYCFASTTFILSMVNIHARGVTVPNVVVGMTLFVGGLGQFLAGMWGKSSTLHSKHESDSNFNTSTEFAAGNTYGATCKFAEYLAFICMLTSFNSIWFIWRVLVIIRGNPYSRFRYWCSICSYANRGT